MNDQSSGFFDFDTENINNTNKNGQNDGDIDLLKQEIQALQKENQSLQKQFEEAIAPSKEKDEIIKRNNELQQKNDSLQLSIKDLNARLDIADNQNKELKKIVAKTKDEFELYRSKEFAKYEQQVNTMKEESQKKIISLTAENENLKRQNERINDEKLQMRKDIQTLLEAVQESFHQQFPNIQSLTEFARNYRASQAKKDSTISQNTQLQENHEKLAKKYTKLEKFARSLAAKCESLEEEKIKQSRQSETEISDAQKIIKNLQREQKVKDDQYAQEKEKLEKLNANLVDKYNQLKADKDEIEKHDKEMSEKLDMIQDKEDQQPIIDNLSKNLKKLQKDKEKYKKQCQEIIPKFKKMEEDHKKLQEKFELQTQNSEKMKNQLETKLNKQQLENNEQQKKINDLQVQNNQLIQKNKECIQNIIQLKEDLSLSKNESAKLSKSLNVLERGIENSSKEIEEYRRIKQVLEKAHNEMVKLMVRYEEEFKKIATDKKQLEQDMSKTKRIVILPEESWKCRDLPTELRDTVWNIGRTTTQKEEVRLKDCLAEVAKYIKKLEDNFVKQNNEASKKYDGLSELLKQLLQVVNDQIGAPNIEPEELFHNPCFIEEISGRFESKSFNLNNTIERSFCAPDSLEKLFDALNAEDISTAEMMAIDMRERILEQNDQIKKIHHKNKQLKDQLKACLIKLDESQNELDSCIKETRQKLDNMQYELEDKESDNERLNSQIKDLKQQLEQLKQEHLEELKESRSRTLNESKIESQQIEKENQKRLKEKEQEIQRIQYDLEKAQKSIEKLKGKNRQLSQEIQNKENEKEQLKEEEDEKLKEQEKQSMNAIESIKEEHNRQINELNKEIQKRDEQIQNNHNIFKESEAKFKQLNEMKRQLEVQVMQLRRDYKAKLDELAREKQLSDAKLRSLKQSSQMNTQNEIESMKMKCEEQKRSWYLLAADAFKQFFDPQIQMSDTAYKDLLKDAKNQLESLIKQDESIRRILGIMGNDNIEIFLKELMRNCHDKNSF